MIARTAPDWCTVPSRLLCSLLGLTLLLLGASAQGGLSVSWNMSFSPDPIGPGSTSTLTYTLTNNSPTGVRNVAFTNVLPAGITLADPASPELNCDGVLSAPDGGTTISLSDGEIPGNGSCVIRVQVTSSVPGTHTNLTGDLTSDAGNSGRVSADLTVDAGLPGFSKSFSPTSVSLGGRSTLTFTIDNSANQSARQNLTFTDALPAGLVIANPPNVVNTCGGGTVTATPGSSSISLTQSFPSAAVDNFATCTVSVDVIAQSVGRLVNLSGELMSTPIGSFEAVSSGKATAALDVTISPIILRKTFIDDPNTPGSTTRVEYTIINRSRDLPLTDIAFSDDFGAALPGLAATGLPVSDWCGPGSSLTGTSLFKLSGGSLPPEGSCTFRLTLQVPASAPPGAYPSTTSQISARLDGNVVTGSPAADTLFIDVAPTLQKTFLQNSATPGDVVTMRFRITNNSTTATATDIAFIDELPAVLVSADVPGNGFCGQSSTAVYTPASQFDPGRLTVSGASLAPGAVCFFDVFFSIAQGASTGTVVNTTEPITAMISGSLVTGNAATGTIDIVSGPSLTKEFLDNPIVPGQVTRLRYTLFHEAETTDPATNISFTDDLGALLPGLVAVGLPQSDICGPGSLVRGTSVVDFSGGSLAPGRFCSFIVNVRVPAEAPVGTITNTTSPVSAVVGGVQVQSGPASANLLISGLSLSKRFLSAAIPGSAVILEFTITNDGNSDATAMSFTDNLDEVVPGMTGVGLPLSNPCGANSSLTGSGNPANSVLIFQGGRLNAGTSCTFTVQVQVPASAQVGSYVNVTSALTATLQGVELPVTLPGASAELELDDRFLELTKSFSEPSVQAGGTVNLNFSLTNIHPTNSISTISFTDSLPGGLFSTAGTLTGFCGPGSQVSGTTTLTVTLPLLNPGQTCNFSIPISVPPGTPFGTLTNTTSEITGTIGGNAVRGDPASANIDILVVLKLLDIHFNLDGTASVVWAGTPGYRYCIEWTEDLINWTRVLPLIPASSEVNTWIDPGPPITPTIPSATRFRAYRVGEKGPGS